MTRSPCALTAITRAKTEARMARQRDERETRRALEIKARIDAKRQAIAKRVTPMPFSTSVL